MREHRNVITCTVATANGFAMPYRARPVPPLEKIPAPQNTKKESSRARVSKSACGRSADRGDTTRRKILTRF
jgi:hypothetical protein